jgi:hypothetical protein
VLADHVDPDQVLADHVLPDQVLPDQVEPDQVLPFQSPPDQVLAVSSSRASEAVSSGCPKMSRSPVSVTSSRLRWSLPRDRSSGPPPVEAVKRCPLYDHWGVAVSIAPSRISPAPCACESKLASLTAFVWKKRLTRSGDIVGYFCKTRATAPEAIAAACEVPLPRK